MLLILFIYAALILETVLFILLIIQARRFNTKTASPPQTIKLTVGAKEMLELQDAELEDLRLNASNSITEIVNLKKACTEK
jgi:hypothetical protein